ncbi:hypothetical protein [Nocardiopsis trehalosi]|uniref:hypothetical protein n=1 Tax=Nocardiopsis trehalosi TaxID=109329 RepID=UPI0008307612|nr:hypothetical protein [Nocardiopsis trehalosi]
MRRLLPVVLAAAAAALLAHPAPAAAAGHRLLWYSNDGTEHRLPAPEPGRCHTVGEDLGWGSWLPAYAVHNETPHTATAYADPHCAIPLADGLTVAPHSEAPRHTTVAVRYHP